MFIKKSHIPTLKLHFQVKGTNIWSEHVTISRSKFIFQINTVFIYVESLETFVFNNRFYLEKSQVFGIRYEFFYGMRFLFL
jgi:hypothetical protein